MTKVRTLFTCTSIMPVVSLLTLAAVFANAHPAVAQDQGDCVLPPGVTTSPNPRVTAQQVEDGSATLKEFAVAVRDQFRVLEQSAEAENLGSIAYTGCLVRQEGSAYHSGSTYLVSLTPDGRVLTHAKDMNLSGRQINLPIGREIISSLGVEPTVLDDLFSSDPETSNMAFGAYLQTLLQEPDGQFDATAPVPDLRPGIPGASGHAAVYFSAYIRAPLMLLAGFDLNESHLTQEVIDYGDPAITARDVVDRETLKAFVAEAVKFIGDTLARGYLTDLSLTRLAFRDPNGPWRHGSVYLYVLDRTSNIIMLHGAFPDRFEMRPLVATVRDVVTGELVLPQVIEAAQSSPEGGFVEYYFDDPNDDTDRADIPKVGYARQFTGQIPRPNGTFLPFDFIVGSGFYGRAPDVVTVVEATVLGDAVDGLVVPEASGLAPNSPNPFNSATLIPYHMSSAGPVKLVIYNVLGQPVRTLVDETRGAGTYQVKWDARDEGGVLLSTGVYIARLSYPGGVATQRLLYLQ